MNVIPIAKNIALITVAKFIHKYFDLISLFFVILFLGSMVYSAYGLYNLVLHGTCSPHSTECVFNPGAMGCGGTKCLENSQCLCEQVICESPDYKACLGDSDCVQYVCG